MELYLDDDETVEKLKQQLTMYKSINSGLSKKVQELKIQLKDTTSELTISQKKLIDEQKRTKELKRCLNTINLQCFQFCTTYYHTVNEIQEQNPEIILDFPNQEATPNSAAQQQPKQIVKPPRRHSLPNDAEMLGAITEESVNMHTSTPFHHPARKLSVNHFMRTFDSMSSNVSH